MELICEYKRLTYNYVYTQMIYLAYIGLRSEIWDFIANFFASSKILTKMNYRSKPRTNI